MKNVNTYEDFLINLIFEREKGQFFFILSNRFTKILEKINHPIAKELLTLNRNMYGASSVSLIDIDGQDISKLTLIPSDKVTKYLEKKHNLDKMGMEMYLSNSLTDLDDIWWQNRVYVNIGKLIAKVFPDKFKVSGDAGRDIESFVNVIKSRRGKDNNAFKVVKGSDIPKYYNASSYSDEADDDTVLGKSCMRHGSCEKYFDFYVKNDIEMLVLFSKEEPNKINGRALVWKIENIDGKKVDRKFMDRIYYTNDYEVDLFKDYAIKHGWLYRKFQNSKLEGIVIDPINNVEHSSKLITTNNFKPTNVYPYMDTFKYYYVESGYLANKMLGDSKDRDIRYLESTIGKFKPLTDKIYVEHYNDYIKLSDLIYCVYGEEYRLKDDAIFVDDLADHATLEYAKENLEFNSETGKWFLPEKELGF
jgi:hypothetical protein